MLRLSSIAQAHYQYDPLGDIFGDGPIHFLVEVGDQLFLAWEDNNTKTVIANPITRFDLGSLEELGLDEAWTVLHVPDSVTERIQFRDIDNIELCEAYMRHQQFPAKA